MRDFVNIKSESNFFQWLKTWTESRIYWERIEPVNECGFPDTTFVMRELGKPSDEEGLVIYEGAIEFKYTDKYQPLGKMLRSSQVVSFIDYFNAGGTKRYVFKYVRHTQSIHIYSTFKVARAILGKDVPSWTVELEGRVAADITAEIISWMENQG